MSQDNFDTNIAQLQAAAELLLRAQLNMPALLLIYAGIDILGAIDRPRDQDESTGEDFRAWADQYLTPEQSLGCTADDLWGARCGLLHTYTSESRHTHKGLAKEVLYAWGIGKSEDYNSVLQQLGFGDKAVAVQVEALYRSFSDGIIRFIKCLEADEERRELVYNRANKFFKQVSPGISRWSEQGQ